MYPIYPSSHSSCTRVLSISKDLSKERKSSFQNGHSLTGLISPKKDILMSEDICMEFSLDQEFPLGKKMSFEGLTKDTRASSLHQESENQINSFLTISDIHTAK
jgi:hypothetical protein